MIRSPLKAEMYPEPLFVEALRIGLQLEANSAQARIMKQYMRHQFDFYGIKAPLRRQIMSHQLKQHPISDPETLANVVSSLYEQPQREYQYIALDLLSKQAKKKQLKKEAITLIEPLIMQKPWWDTVDPLAVQVVGPLFEAYPQLLSKTLAKWRKSSHLWIRRTTLIYQLSYKARTNESLLLEIIEENLTSSNFFIQKAIGWALRQYSYTNPRFVLHWTSQLDFSPLAHREALKAIQRKESL